MAGVDESAQPVVVLFGPQRTNWTTESLKALQTTLKTEPDFNFLGETLKDLPSLGTVVDEAFNHKVASKRLQWHSDFAKGGEVRNVERLDNSILAPLTVVYQAVDLITKSRSMVADGSLPKFQSCQGFCVGFLSAASLASSVTWEDYRRYVSNAIRLAACIGMIIDDELASTESPKHVTALSVRWKTPSDRAHLEMCLDSFPEAYISCVTDETSLTITVPKSSTSALCKLLQNSNIPTMEIGLTGRYHHPNHAQASEILSQLCSSLEGLQLPLADQLVLPLRTTVDGSIIHTGSLHDWAIQLILCKRAHWFHIVKQTLDDFPEKTQARLVAIGGDSCIPRSLSKGKHTQHKTHTQNDDTSREEIAVVGMACRFPEADNLHEFWDLLKSGRSALNSMPNARFNPDDLDREPKLKQFWGNFIRHPDAFDHRFFDISGREAKSMDPQQRLALQVAYEALEASGYCSLQSSERETDVGCYLGVGAVDYEDNIASESASAFSATGTLRAFISGRISHYFGWSGPSLTIDTACSSSAVAIHTACKALLGGECSMALAGGVNVITSPNLHQNLAGASFLNPNGASRAFDENAGGYCRGEGAGILVLKPLSKAIAAGDDILGVISATAVNQGGNCTSITVPDSHAQASLYKRALSFGAIQPSEVTYVEAHGTGTQVGDPIEYESIRTALTGPSRHTNLYIGSVKDNIGHAEAASGVAGVIKTLLMMHNKMIPQQANFKTLNPKIRSASEDLMVVPDVTQPWTDDKQIAMVNNYGAAGSNAVVLLRKHVSQPDAKILTAQQQSSEFPIMLAAKTQSQLELYIDQLRSFMLDTQHAHGNIAWSIARRQNPAFEHRAAFVLSDTTDVSASLGSVSTTRSPKIPVVLTFGGQTGRTCVISKELYDMNGLLRNHLDKCNLACEIIGLPSIIPRIFEGGEVEDLVLLHCMLLSLQVSTAKCWIDSGAEVESVIGHSFGQISALCVAESISLKDALQFVGGRARLIQENWGAAPGAMLSVECSENELQTALKELRSSEGLRLDIACYNGPSSFVLSGDDGSIEKAEHLLSHNFNTKQLKNSHAYHSSMADGIMDEVSQLAATIHIRPPRLRVETCSSKSSWDAFTERELAQHTREPVFFSEAVERIAHRLPSAIWLEAGSASPIIPMARRVLRESKRSDIFIGLNLGGIDATANLVKATCQLWQAGSATKYWLFHKLSRYNFETIHVPPYQFERISHWIDLKPKSTKRAADGVVAADSAFNEPNLVTLLKHKSSESQKIFVINTFHPTFQLASKGHAVASKPLCPASLYIELATRCMMAIGTEMRKLPYLEELVMSAPLGLGSHQQVFLYLEKAIEENWKFLICGRPSIDTEDSQHTTEYANGLVTLLPTECGLNNMRLKMLQKFAKSSRLDRLMSDPSATGISGQFVYKIFADVVDYASYYRGVRNLTALDNEAIGAVVLPNEPHVLDDTMCDPISLDNFLQVAGIHVNCLSPRKNGEVFMCTSVNEVVFSTEFVENRSTDREWIVHTQYESPSENMKTNDTLVCERHSGKVVVAILGATFRAVSFKSLMRNLSKMEGASRAPRQGGYATPSLFTAQDSGYQSRSTSPLSSGERKDMPTHRRSIETTPPISPTQQAQISASKNVRDMLQTLRKILSEIIEVPIEEVQPVATLDDLGIDSLLVTEVISEIKKRCLVSITQEDFMACTNVQSLADRLSPSAATSSNSVMHTDRDKKALPVLEPKVDNTESACDEEEIRRDNIAIAAGESFSDIRHLYSQYAETTGFTDFCTEVHPLQSELVTQYVVEAFKSLGCDLDGLPSGSQIPHVRYDHKHSNVIKQLHRVLEDAGLVETTSQGGFCRTDAPLPRQSASALHELMLTKYPKHASETKLLRTTAHKLAECLSGVADPIALLFGDADARSLLSDVYANAPMFKTGTLVLGEYISSLVQKLDSNQEIRILELGAGTGGTTQHIVETLAALGTKHRLSYTFTDLSSSLIMAAKKKFKKWSFMDFKVIDVEKEPDAIHVGAYDIVISTNCIHATRDLVRSTTHIRKLLRPDGILCLLELTRNLYWFDLVFGLLEGWWLSSDGREHALASEKQWNESLRSAGYSWVKWTNDSTAESNILRMIVASPFHVGDDSTITTEATQSKMKKRETVTYKTVDDLDLLADVYYPQSPIEPGRTLPVALMIHGGGHVMLSRKDVRPEQTAFLLHKGFLPISIDYRLCPEVTLQEGPMNDVADALSWIRTGQAQTKLSRSDIHMDPDNIVAVGWSTGGHLAMTLAWTSIPRQIRPPEAILAFYCPTDYEDVFWSKPNIPDNSRVGATATYELDDEIWNGLSDRPIANYNVLSGKLALGKWLAPTDPRSRLALYMNYQGCTVPVLVNGLNKKEKSAPRMPTVDEVKSISPLSQAQRGAYKTPTFIIHPRQDDLIPWQQAERTHRALLAAGVDTTLRIVEEGPHLFDLEDGYKSNHQARKVVSEGYDFLCKYAGLA